MTEHAENTAVNLVTLDTDRIPGYPESRLSLDNSPLQIVEGLAEHVNADSLTTAIGIATVLYRWCPDALYAFLDLEAWFSFTWLLTIPCGDSDVTKVEIGRVQNQITFGSLDKDGEKWNLMITYNISRSEPDRGSWIPNPGESMLDGKDIEDPTEVDTLGRNFVRDLILNQRWLAARGGLHQLFVEYAPMDIFGDGIPMNPHWLYKTLDISRCTTCDDARRSPSQPLSRCGRCGTAAYCSAECQRKDWSVHKAICNMSVEDRGQALHLSQHGGLINWDRSRDDQTEPEATEKGLSSNPNFVGPPPKRRIYHPAELPA